MSDQEKDEEVDKVSGGIESHPMPIHFKPKPPPTTPVDPIGGKKSDPVNPGG
jgi:hypothetical protein